MVRALQVRDPASDIVLRSWTRHITLTMPLSTQEYIWVPSNCWGNLTSSGEVTCDGLASRPGGVEILLTASCYAKTGKAPAAMGQSWLQGFTKKKISINLTACNIQQKRTIKYLGIFIEENLKWDAHIQHVNNRIAKKS